MITYGILLHMLTKNKKLPKISIVLPTYNSENDIKKALVSIYKQNYPSNLLEVIIVDDESTDNTILNAKKFPVKILTMNDRDPEIAKMIGLKASTGDFFYYYDSDMELLGNNFFQSLLYPLQADSEIVGAFARNYADRSAPSLERYYAMDPIHRDAIYELFSPSVESTVIKDCGKYKLCQYSIDKIPPAARCLYRMDEIKEVTKNNKKFLELDILKIFVERGRNKFAYVEHPGKYHHHASSLKQLLDKRKRNLQKVYLETIQDRKYTWFSLHSKKDIFKILVLVLYANTFLFSTVRGICKSIKFRDFAGMWEPIVAFAVTDSIILSFITSKKGMRFILDIFSK